LHRQVQLLGTAGAGGPGDGNGGRLQRQARRLGGVVDRLGAPRAGGVADQPEAADGRGERVELPHRRAARVAVGHGLFDQGRGERRDVAAGHGRGGGEDAARLLQGGAFHGGTAHGPPAVQAAGAGAGGAGGGGDDDTRPVQADARPDRTVPAVQRDRRRGVVAGNTQDGHVDRPGDAAQA